MACGFLLTLGFLWEALGSAGLPYILALAAVFLGFVLFSYQGVEKEKQAFLSLREAMK